MGVEGESLHIVIPAYNERDNIREVVEGWHSAAERVGGGLVSSW